MILKEQQKTEYLKEAVRLAELRLEEQNIALTLQEKKSALIATFCIVIIGYLLTFTGDIEQVSRTLDYLFRTKLGELWPLLIFKIIPSSVLALAMLYSIRSLNLADIGIRGAPPEYTLDNYFKRNLNKLAKELLENYNDRIKENQEMLETKNEEMRKARNWLFIGTPLAVILVIARELLQIC